MLTSGSHFSFSTSFSKSLWTKTCRASSLRSSSHTFCRALFQTRTCLRPSSSTTSSSTPTRDSTSRRMNRKTIHRRAESSHQLNPRLRALKRSSSISASIVAALSTSLPCSTLQRRKSCRPVISTWLSITLERMASELLYTSYALSIFSLKKTR